MRLYTKDKRKDASPTHARILGPARSGDKENGLYAPTQLRLARPHDAHDTHETKRRQNEAGLLVMGADKPNQLP